MSALHAILTFVVLERVLELLHARRNTRRLRAAGAVEHGAGHYPLLILLHGAWLGALFVFVPADAPVFWPLIGLFLLLQLARLWVIVTLGERWTTRILVLPGAPLVRRGPYRFLRHPNYAIVAAELALLPLAFGAWPIALLFSSLNLALLRHRIRIEDAALRVGHPSAKPSQDAFPGFS